VEPLFGIKKPPANRRLFCYYTDFEVPVMRNYAGARVITGVGGFRVE
jgi:hypothetical protein